MSAPEVRVLYRPGESLSPGYPWARECEGCDETVGYWRDRADCERYAAEHENACPAIQLARLQARWDARDAALHALVEQWRAESGNWQVDRCADELERAMGGGR